MTVLTDAEAVRALEELLKEGPQEESVLEKAFEEFLEVKVDWALFKMWSDGDLRLCLKGEALAWALSKEGLA